MHEISVISKRLGWSAHNDKVIAPELDPCISCIQHKDMTFGSRVGFSAELRFLR